MSERDHTDWFVAELKWRSLGPEIVQVFGPVGNDRGDEYTIQSRYLSHHDRDDDIMKDMSQEAMDNIMTEIVAEVMTRCSHVKVKKLFVLCLKSSVIADFAGFARAYKIRYAFG